MQARLQEIKDRVNNVNDGPLTPMGEDMAFVLEVLQKAQTELAQYRENPLLLMKPCWKYVRQNDINMQNQHVKSECLEVDKAMTLEELALEWWDILQGAVTGIFILKVKYGVDLQGLFQRGIEKNTNRVGGSYYG